FSASSVSAVKGELNDTNAFGWALAPPAESKALSACAEPSAPPASTVTALLPGALIVHPLGASPVWSESKSSAYSTSAWAATGAPPSANKDNASIDIDFRVSMDKPPG